MCTVIIIKYYCKHPHVGIIGVAGSPDTGLRRVMLVNGTLHVRIFRRMMVGSLRVRIRSSNVRNI